MKLHWIILVIFVIIFVGCKSNSQSPSMQTKNEPPEQKMQSLEQVAREKFGDEYQIDWNPSKKAVLVIQKAQDRKRNPFPTLRFLLYDFDQKLVLFEDTVAKGTVDWVNEEEVKVNTIQGMMRSRNLDENQSGYIYNWIKKEKRRLK